MELVEVTRTRSRPALLAAVVVVALFALLAPTSSLTGATWLFAATAVVCGTLLVSGGGPYRASAVYLVVFAVFHGGLLVNLALRGTAALVAADSGWVYSAYTPRAAQLAVLGMAAFTLAVELVGGRRTVVRGPRRAAGALRVRADGVVTVLALSVQLAGFAVFVAAVRRAGGLDLLSGGYGAFLETTESDGALGFGTLAVGIGAVVAVTAGGRGRVVAWLVFAAYAVLAFPIGTRGAVLFPLLALLVVEARRGKRMRPVHAVLAGIGVLVLIGLVRLTRTSGLASLSSVSAWSAPLDAVAEMGYSLRPTTVVLQWHDALNEPFRAGVTLLVVPLRAFESLFGLRGGAPEYDDRLFNAEIMARVGPIGGSPVAEGYHNAGVLGVVLVLATIGVVIGWLERRPSSWHGDAILGVVLLPLLLQVRNSFAPVPVQLALGLALVACARLLAARASGSAVEPPRGELTSPATTSAGP